MTCQVSKIVFDIVRNTTGTIDIWFRRRIKPLLDAEMLSTEKQYGARKRKQRIQFMALLLSTLKLLGNTSVAIIIDMQKWEYRKVQNTVKCMKTEGTNAIFGDQRSSQNQREFIVSRHFVRHRCV